MVIAECPWQTAFHYPSLGDAAQAWEPTLKGSDDRPCSKILVLELGLEEVPHGAGIPVCWGSGSRWLVRHVRCFEFVFWMIFLMLLLLMNLMKYALRSGSSKMKSVVCGGRSLQVRTGLVW